MGRRAWWEREKISWRAMAGKRVNNNRTRQIWVYLTNMLMRTHPLTPKNHHPTSPSKTTWPRLSKESPRSARRAATARRSGREIETSHESPTQLFLPKVPSFTNPRTCSMSSTTSLALSLRRRSPLCLPASQSQRRRRKTRWRWSYLGCLQTRRLLLLRQSGIRRRSVVRQRRGATIRSPV